MDDKIYGAATTGSHAPVHEFLTVHRNYPSGRMPFCLVPGVFCAAMVLQQRGKIDISYAISFFSDLLKRVEHDRYLKSFAGYRLFLIKPGPQTPAVLHVDYMAGIPARIIYP